MVISLRGRQRKYMVISLQKDMLQDNKRKKIKKGNITSTTFSIPQIKDTST